MRKLSSTAVLLSLASTAHAAAGDIKGEEITQLVSGALVEIDTPLGKSIPVRYDAAGRMSGNAGELASYLGSANDKGRWWIAGDQLCHKWLRWFSGEEQCLRLKKEGGRFRWTNHAGMSGTARIIAAAAPGAGPAAATGNTVMAAKANSASAPSDTAATGKASRRGPQSLAQDFGGGSGGTGMRLAGPAAGKSEPVGSARAPAAGGQAERAHRVANVGAGDVLNVRGGPSSEDAVVGTLKPEERGIRMAGDCRSRWCPITHAGVSGWVNAAYLVAEGGTKTGGRARGEQGRDGSTRDAAEASRACLTEPARALLDQIETRFGPMRVISTCRPGATIAGTGRTSRHASGNAIDFDAGARKAEVIAWLVTNHKAGGTMTYPDMDHVHVDVGRHFVSLAGGRLRTSSRRGGDGSDGSGERMGLTGSRVR